MAHTSQEGHHAERPQHQHPQRLRILLVGDPDLVSATRLVEWVIATEHDGDPPDQHGLVHHTDPSHGPTCWDLCCVLGPFIHRAAPELVVAEERAADEGEMSAIIAQLENVVCRVVYAPGPGDPVMPAFTGVNGTPQLTGTSQNLHNRVLRLLPGLCIGAYTQAQGQEGAAAVAALRRLCTLRPTVAHTAVVGGDAAAAPQETMLLLSCTDVSAAPGGGEPGGEPSGEPGGEPSGELGSEPSGEPSSGGGSDGALETGWLPDLWSTPEFNAHVGMHAFSGHQPSGSGQAPASAGLPPSAVAAASLRQTGCFAAVDLQCVGGRWSVVNVQELRLSLRP